MARVRGDDELLELLGIMGGTVAEKDATMANDSPQINGNRGDDHQTTSRPPTSLAAEAACVPETGWNRSIWNPHVIGDVISTVGQGVSKELSPAGGVGEGATVTKLVSPQEEALRQQAVSVVFSRFQVLCKELGIRGKNEMFERWQFSRKLKEGRGGDPILPAGAYFDKGLDAELQELGVPRNQSKNLCCELGRASKSALKTLTKQLRVAGGSPQRVSAKITDENTYVLQFGKNRLRMNSAHYVKMKELFRRARVDRHGARVLNNITAGGTADANGGWEGKFHDCLFACLMRYEALQGGGFQASMDGDAFDVLLRHLDVKMECFASPFNCRYTRFCSAFADTDKPFGSVGSFFDFWPTEGAFEANPPFVRDVILKMANHMDDLLKATSEALTFVVIIPAWEDSDGWVRLKDSRFLSRHVKLDQKDHGYCEGKQHLRRNRYRLASFHTSVFFLQTAAASGEWPVTQHVCDELAQAFAPKQETGGSDPDHTEGNHQRSRAGDCNTSSTADDGESEAGPNAAVLRDGKAGNEKGLGAAVIADTREDMRLHDEASCSRQEERSSYTERKATAARKAGTGVKKSGSDRTHNDDNDVGENDERGRHSLTGDKVSGFAVGSKKRKKQKGHRHGEAAAVGNGCELSGTGSKEGSPSMSWGQSSTTDQDRDKMAAGGATRPVRDEKVEALKFVTTRGGNGKEAHAQRDTPKRKRKRKAKKIVMA